jgi:hypothetical protein
MPRPQFCPTCRIGATDRDKIVPTAIGFLQRGCKLFASVRRIDSDIGVIHRFVVTDICTAVSATHNGSRRAFAIKGTGVDAENGGKPGRYFIPLDMDALLTSERQTVPILVDDTKLGICSVLIEDRSKHPTIGPLMPLQ